MKRKLITLLTLALTITLLSGCGSEAGSGVSKGDTMTVSEMFDALVEDNGGEAMIFATKANKLNTESNVSVYTYAGGTTINVYRENVLLGEIMSGAVETTDLYGEVEIELLLNLVTDEDNNALTDEAGNVLYEEILSTNTKFDGTNISRIDIDGTAFIVIATSRPSDNQNPNDYLLFPETESMVGKTIVMDSVGTEGVYVNLEED